MARIKSHPRTCLPTRTVRLVVLAICISTLITLSLPERTWRGAKMHLFGPSWQHYQRLSGYYSGLRNLVPASQLLHEHSHHDVSQLNELNESFEEEQEYEQHLTEYDPYGQQDVSHKQGSGIKKCYLDEEHTVEVPKMYAYHGVPQYHPNPLHGSYKVLGLRDDVCFERHGRLAAYSSDYDLAHHGHEQSLKDKSHDLRASKRNQINWSAMNWGDAQARCRDANKHRFTQEMETENETALPETKPQNTTTRSAIVLRTWTGYHYTPQVLMNLRALISEVALGSSGEYDIHLLVHVKDNELPFWEYSQLYDKIRQESVPQELQGLVTLWSERQMEKIYPGPYVNNTMNRSHKPVHGVYRSSHMPLQYFAQTHPEYAHFWNWEMDLRYIGHYYELFSTLGTWAQKQPRKGIWERSGKYYLEGVHQDWETFSSLVTRENSKSGHEQVWGPVTFPDSPALKSNDTIWPPHREEEHSTNTTQWGVGEQADLITLSPLFDPTNTHWYFSNDITGYPLSPPPPRRVSIIAAARLSSKLLSLMHQETQSHHHTMWTEMYPPSIALHYGLKAVYAPHPVYYDRKWPLDVADKTFNAGLRGASGGNGSSVFGWFEHNHLGSTWYHNARFAGRLWRRWLGREEGREEVELEGGRMCLRSMLLHPVKFD